MLDVRTLQAHCDTSPIVANVASLLTRSGITVHDDDLLLEEYERRDRDTADLITSLAARGVTTIEAFDALIAEAPSIEPALGVFRDAVLSADREPGGTIEDLLTIVVFLLRPATRDEVEGVYGEPTASAIIRAVAAASGPAS